LFVTTDFFSYRLYNYKISTGRPLSYGSWISNYLCNFESCSGEVYSIQHYVIKFVSDLRQSVVWWLVGTPVSSTNKTNLHNITEIMLKVTLNVRTPSPMSTTVTVLILLSNCFVLINHKWSANTIQLRRFQCN
jgi:hypothetical protein